MLMMVNTRQWNEEVIKESGNKKKGEGVLNKYSTVLMMIKLQLMTIICLWTGLLKKLQTNFGEIQTNLGSVDVESRCSSPR